MLTEFSELNERSRAIFRFIVDSYLETGEPVASRTISRAPGFNVSPATIRNVMAELADMGLLSAPHISAGRMPTQSGLRFYVDGVMQRGSLAAEDRERIESAAAAKGRPIKEIYEEASNLLSGLSSCASLVLAPTRNASVRQIQFMRLEPGRTLGMLVMSNGMVENRILETPRDLPESALSSAANYINSRLEGATLDEAQTRIKREMQENRAQLDALSARLVEQGLAIAPASAGHIIVRGQSKLLQDIEAMGDIESVREILSKLEDQETMLDILSKVENAQGVQIFIGSENEAFARPECSMIIAPYKNGEHKIVGAIGVVGPKRLNYAKIIPMVDYTSRVVEKLIEDDMRWTI